MHIRKLAESRLHLALFAGILMANWFIFIRSFNETVIKINAAIFIIFTSVFLFSIPFTLKREKMQMNQYKNWADPKSKTAKFYKFYKRQFYIAVVGFSIAAIFSLFIIKHFYNVINQPLKIYQGKCFHSIMKGTQVGYGNVSAKGVDLKLENGDTKIRLPFNVSQEITDFDERRFDEQIQGYPCLKEIRIKYLKNVLFGGRVTRFEVIE